MSVGSNDGLARIPLQKRTHFRKHKATPPRKLRVNTVPLANIVLGLNFSYAFFFRVCLWRWTWRFTFRLIGEGCYLLSSGFQCSETFDLSLVFGFKSFDKVPRVLDE